MTIVLLIFLIILGLYFQENIPSQRLTARLTTQISCAAIPAYVGAGVETGLAGILIPVLVTCWLVG